MKQQNESNRQRNDRKDGEKMTNTEWIDIQTVDSKDRYIVNIHNISMIHYESNTVFLAGKEHPLHITGQSMEKLYETVLRNM